MERQLIEIILLGELDSEEELDDRDEEDRIRIDVENWKTLGDPTFEQHFRMNRTTFDLLLVAVGTHLENENRFLRKSRKGLDVALMMTLWVLASPDTFRSVGVKFGVLKGVVHFHYKYIIEALREMAPTYIQWPNAFEKERIAQSFEDQYGYPSVAGCIDGCLIEITAPLEHPQEYVDWHNHYSIQLQGVCDDNMLFRDAYVGQPGSVGDKRSLRRSPLGRRIFQPDVLMDKHLLGDGGYTLTSKLMIPYRNDGQLTPRMRTHNYYLSRCRSIIERSFALLKGKWRRLKYFPNYCVEYAVDHLMACVVLHNFIILKGNAYEVQHDQDNCEPPHIRQLTEQAKAEGALKRDSIATLLHPDD